VIAAGAADIASAVADDDFYQHVFEIWRGSKLMSEYEAKLSWSLGAGEMAFGKYSTNHRMTFSGGLSATLTAAPEYGGDSRYVNPEQALAAALSSCHMMTFIALAAKARWKLRKYQDRAVALLGKTDDGRTRVSEIVLHPVTEFEPGHEIEPGKLSEMHERAHRYCFVANAISCEMRVEL
jgi:organic hydroperoxide reductase OsmC/OhrA